MREPANADSSRPLSRVFLAQIVVATIVGMVLSLVVEPVLESSGATIFVLLLAISVSEVIMARFVVRKQMTRREEGSKTQARVLASAFAGAIAVYGLIIGILTGHWFLVVPFGAIAFFASRYLHDLIEEENEPLRLGSRR